MIRRWHVLAALLLAAQPACAAALLPEKPIPLPGTSGRIDHMAIDLAHGHLFIAELGNGTVDVVDPGSHKVIHRIDGLKEPQGIAYAPQPDLIAVASGGDGSLHLFRGTDFKARSVIRLGDDADNVRLDPRNGHLIVGYGDGALAVIDPAAAAVIRTVRLPGHPESFRLDGARVYVNVPSAGLIVLGDIDTGKVTGQWKPERLSDNFPMILDGAGHVAVVFRSPARLVLYDAATGRPDFAADTCGDADDLFFDRRHGRFYVSCGAGLVDVFASSGGLKRLARIKTSWGSRTSLYVPATDRLYVAERAGLLGHDAAVAVFAPAP